MGPNTPSQIWSADSSPLPSFNAGTTAHEYSLVGIKRKGTECTEVLDRPSLMSPGSVMQAATKGLPEQLESLPNVSKSGPHSTPSSDHLRAGIADRATSTKDVDVNSVLLVAGTEVSDTRSDISSLDSPGKDEEAWQAADTFNDDVYSIGVEYVNG